MGLANDLLKAAQAADILEGGIRGVGRAINEVNSAGQVSPVAKGLGDQVPGQPGVNYVLSGGGVNTGTQYSPPTGGSAKGGSNSKSSIHDGYKLGPPPVEGLCTPIYDEPMILNGQGSSKKKVLVGWVCKASVTPPQAAGVYINPEQATFWSSKGEQLARGSGSVGTGSASSGASPAGPGRSDSPIGGSGGGGVILPPAYGDVAGIIDAIGAKIDKQSRSIENAFDKVTRSSIDLADAVVNSNKAASAAISNIVFDLSRVGL